MQCKINSVLVTLVNIYLPPPMSLYILESIFKKLLELPPAPFCLLGDFNTPLNPKLDKLTPQTISVTPLALWDDGVALTEVWRWKHPQSRQYLCYSVTHKTLSRIDFAFASQTFLPLIMEASYLPRAFLDHSPLLLTLCVNPCSVVKTWQLSPLWLKHSIVSETITQEYKDYKKTPPPPICAGKLLKPWLGEQ